MKKLLSTVLISYLLTLRATEMSVTLASFADVPPGTLNEATLVMQGIDTYTIAIAPDGVTFTNAPTSFWPYTFQFVSGAPLTSTTVVVTTCTVLNTHTTNTFILTAYSATPPALTGGRWRTTYGYK